MCRWQPTAQALPADVAATPVRLHQLAVAGLGTCFHTLPFQRTIRALELEVLPVEPTAQALLTEVAATPLGAPLMAKEAAGSGDPARAAAAVTGAIPATIPASSSGTVRTLTERVTSWGVRMGCYLP